MPRATSGVGWTGASIFMYQYHGVGLLRTYADFQFHFIILADVRLCFN